ncbi:MAG: flagellar biosynthesis protein [Elusimicrobia bacterium]|jgi:hypothetical protein|nr:flagellar biosynthesis protein [Elusimicrobiota bacterium]
MGSRLGYLLSVTGLAFFLGGCAVGRGTLHVQVSLPENPAKGISVRIADVTDSRVFEHRPKRASTPSLMNASDYSNDEIKSRAIARKRGGYGQALGDILLPEGATVRALVKDIMTRALRESGYSVLKTGDPGASAAIPITVDIKEFWGWFTPGFAVVSVEFKSDLKVTGNIPEFSEGKNIHGNGVVKGMSATTRTWNAAMNKHIEDIVQKVRQK